MMKAAKVMAGVNQAMILANVSLRTNQVKEEAKEFGDISFGGKKNPGTYRQSVLNFLEQVKKANEMMIDRCGFESTSILEGNYHNFLI